MQKGNPQIFKEWTKQLTQMPILKPKHAQSQTNCPSTYSNLVNTNDENDMWFTIRLDINDKICTKLLQISGTGFYMCFACINLTNECAAWQLVSSCLLLNQYLGVILLLKNF